MKYTLPLPDILPVGELGPFEVPAWGGGFKAYGITLRSPNWPAEGVHSYGVNGIEVISDCLIVEVETCLVNTNEWVSVYRTGLIPSVWRRRESAYDVETGKYVVRLVPTDTTGIGIKVGTVGAADGKMIDVLSHPADRIRLRFKVYRAVEVDISVEGIP